MVLSWYISKISAKNWEITQEIQFISKQHGEGDIILTKKQKNKRLSIEILKLLALSFFIALFLLQILGMISIGIIENFLFWEDIVLTDAQYVQLDDWVFNLSLLVSVLFFVILFLFLLGERLSYIHEILKGIPALQNGNEDYVVPLEGNNELTRLAKAVNYLSRTQQEIKKKERLLNEEKEQFIRALSHDIRTPLTSILSYSALLTDDTIITPTEKTHYLNLIQNKALQIKDMTDILLDGNKRNLEHFENIHLLMEQLIGEFEELLEDEFQIETSLNCPAFSGTFDVQELRRIFDNLISNIQKYADPNQPVKLSVLFENTNLIISQENVVRTQSAPAESYQIGLRSIQRIVQNYDGHVDVQKLPDSFHITIVLSNI